MGANDLLSVDRGGDATVHSEFFRWRGRRRGDGEKREVEIRGVSNARLEWKERATPMFVGTVSPPPPLFESYALCR